MAMVYDIPRLTNQTAFKIFLHVDLHLYQDYMTTPTRIEQLKLAFRQKFGDVKLVKYMNEDLMDYYDLIDMNYDATKTKLMEEDADESETYFRYQMSEIAKYNIKPNPTVMYDTVANFGKSMLHLLDYLTASKDTCKRRVWTDWEAAARVLDYITSPSTRAQLTADQMAMLTSSFELAKDQCSISLAACKLGFNVINKFQQSYIIPGLRHPRWQHFKAIYKGFEALRMSSMTPQIREAFNQIRGGNTITSSDELKVVNKTMYTNFGMNDEFSDVGIYRWLNSYIFVLENDICILDIANLEQLQIVSKQWEGAYLYAMHYRAFGDPSRDNYLDSLLQVDEWMRNNFRDCNFSDSFCRVMKMGLAILQNSLHSNAEKFETGWEEKDVELRKMQEETLHLPVHFQDFLMGLNVKDRTRLDLANTHYFNICPDGDPHALFKKVNEDMANPNPGNPAKFQEFMRYAVTLFLCKTVLKYGRDCVEYIVCEEGYEFESKLWFINLLEGKKDWRMPPINEWGKAKVVGFYGYTDTISGWYYEADDVSHIIADYNRYSTYQSKAELTREDTNELLYAIKYAPMLSYKWDPTTILGHITNGTDTWDRISDLSVKAEANKPSHKARDIHAADDITRVLTSAIDQQAIHVGRLLPGVVSRKDLRASERIFDELCELTRADRRKTIWVVSSDVSSWSPKAPRELWAQFNDLIMEMTAAPKELRIRKVWEGISNLLAKRGYLRASSTSKGMYQGWTGTGDSVMHNALLGYIVNQAKRKGILNPKVTASTATLIDDAVQIIVFDDGDFANMDPEERENLLSEICRRYGVQIREGYSDCGGVIDLAKTIMSTIKAIFLNQVVCEGTKIFTPMKVFAKCDREIGRRSATIFDQIDTIMGSYRAAVEKGAEPILTYVLALERCNELVCMTSRRGVVTVYPGERQAKHQYIINASFAPRNFGGWSYPHIVGWLTKESPDSLSSYVSLIAAADDLLLKAGQGLISRPLASLRNAFHYTINQPTCAPTLSGFIKDATRISIVGVTDPRSAVIANVRSQLAKKAESNIFRELLSRSNDDNMSEALDAFLLSGTFSVDALSLLADCLPEHCASGLTDKALMNDMVQVLFPYRVRSQISRTVKIRNKVAINKLLGIQDNEDYHTMPILRTEIYYIVRGLRQRWYDSLGYRITNHTKQDYATSFTHHFPGQPYSLEVSFEPLISGCPSECVNYASLYDGHVAAPKKSVLHSKNVFKFSRDFERSGDPVRVCLTRAAVIAIYLTTQGKNGVQLWEFVKSAWGAGDLTTFPTVEYKAEEMASIKRISSASGVFSHPIACYTGNYGAVTVNTVRFGAYVTASKYAGDILSVIVAARAVGLLEYSSFISSNRMPPEKLLFGFVEDSLWDYDYNIWEIDDANEFAAAISILDKSPRMILKNEFIKVVTTEVRSGLVSDRPDYNDEMARVAFSAMSRPDANLRETNRNIYTFVTSGYSLPAGTYVSKRSRRMAGDYTEHDSSRGLKTRYQTHCSIIGKESASVAILIEQVCSYLPNEVPTDLLDKTWPELFKHFALNYSDYLKFWKEIMNGLRNTIVPAHAGISEEALRDLFPTMCNSVNASQLNSFCKYNLIRNRHLSDFMVTLYMANFGHYQDPSGYQYAAKNGIFHMKVSWNTTYRRFSVKRNDIVRNLMATVFLSLRNNANSALSAVALYQSFLEGLRRAVELRFPEVDTSGIASAFSPLVDDASEEVQRLGRWFGTNIRAPYALARNATSVFTTIVGYIIGDIKIISMSRSRRGTVTMFSASCPDGPDASNWRYMKPGIVNYDQPMVIADVENEGDGLDSQTEGTIYAVKLYANRGIELAKAYLDELNAGSNPPRDPIIESLEVDDETYEDFKQELAALLQEEELEGHGVQDIA